jgi:hypothetical protein
MKISKQLVAGALGIMLVVFLWSAFSFAASAEQADNSWLNGKWSGQPPEGGDLTMTLSVDKDNKIHGSGIIPVRGGREAHPEVSGSVKGKQVVLQTFFSDAKVQRTVYYNCRFADNALQCKTKAGYKTTFKKVD